MQTLGHRHAWWTLGLALALGGCPSDPATPGPDAGPGADSPPAADAPAAGRSIADIAAGSPDFSMLVAAASRAGLVELLDAPGTYTVFAPTDAAFAASGITMAMIESMPVADLTGILTYHALGAEVPSTAITAGPTTTVATLTLFLGTTGGVTLNGGSSVTGGANVVTADVEADNGVVHVIDRVLLPPNIPALAVYGGLSTLAAAVGSAGLLDALSGAGPFTVFAPTNEAFAALPAVPSGDALATVLLHHVVRGSVLSTAVPAMAPSLAPNAYGDDLTLLFDTSSGVVVNGRATVTVADLRATNGIVHVVDEVLLPMNVVDAATAAGLTGLLGAVGAAAEISPGVTVADALAAQAPYTVFAPDDDAFAAAASILETLTPTDVRDVLLFHVLDPAVFTAPVLAADLPTAGSDLATLNAAPMAFSPGPPPTVDGAGIAVTDIVVTNGVVHVIDAVMVP